MAFRALCALCLLLTWKTNRVNDFGKIMAELFPDVAERSRKNESIILRRLASVGQAVVATGLGLHESSVSRMKDGELERLSRLLAILGLKAVPIEMRCYPENEINAIFTLARQSLERAHSAADLFEDQE